MFDDNITVSVVHNTKESRPSPQVEGGVEFCMLFSKEPRTRKTPRSRIEVRPTALLCYHAHTPGLGRLTWHIDFQFQVSNKFKGQLVQTDGRTDATDCFTLPALAVGNEIANNKQSQSLK